MESARKFEELRDALEELGALASSVSQTARHYRLCDPRFDEAYKIERLDLSGLLEALRYARAMNEAFERFQEDGKL